MLAGSDNLIKASRIIISLGVKKLIVKKGEHGLFYMTKKDFFTIPGYPLEKVLDPTGAGDTFAGGFLGFLSKSKKLDLATFKKAMVYGSVMASYNVQGFDLKVLNKLNKKLIDKRYREFEKLAAF